MIKFFRHIRQSLITENKTKKYFKYAAGEIILVVIGILIALQINNWNEKRKIRTFEKDIITLIDQNLIQDSLSLSHELKTSQKAQASTDRLLQIISKEIYTDTLYTLMGDIINFERFKSHSSAFEVLKSKGIDIINNKKLQIALISYYDEVLFRTNQSILDVEKSFNADWVPVLKTDFSDFKWREYAIPLNKDVFFKKPSTLVLFNLFKDNRAGQEQRMEITINKISEIRNLIKVSYND